MMSPNLVELLQKLLLTGTKPMLLVHNGHPQGLKVQALRQDGVGSHKDMDRTVHQASKNILPLLGFRLARQERGLDAKGSHLGGNLLVMLLGQN